MRRDYLPSGRIGEGSSRGNRGDSLRRRLQFSPHLLQISGIGPGNHLRKIGVDVLHDLTGVGGNLADHWGARIKHNVRASEITMNQLSRFPRVVSEIAKFFLFGDGALTFGVTSAMVFCRSREGLVSPDVQLSFTPATPIDTGQGALEKDPGFQITAIPVRAESRGHVMARNADPMEDPAITPAYLTDENDIDVVVSGIEKVREICEAAPLKRSVLASLRRDLTFGRAMKLDSSCASMAARSTTRSEPARWVRILPRSLIPAFACTVSKDYVSPMRPSCRR